MKKILLALIFMITTNLYASKKCNIADTFATTDGSTHLNFNPTGRGISKKDFKLIPREELKPGDFFLAVTNSDEKTTRKFDLTSCVFKAFNVRNSTCTQPDKRIKVSKVKIMRLAKDDQAEVLDEFSVETEINGPSFYTYRKNLTKESVKELLPCHYY